MSAIAGILQTGGLADPTLTRRMLKAMAHRCPDGSAVWQREIVGLAHGLLRTLPQPDQNASLVVEGDLALTADARLDNREELIATLELDDQPVSDDALILAAYRRWGESCPEHLLGDFAFALWDGRSNALFCARDHFGVKPFYYHATAQRFVFGSELKALFVLPDVPRSIDENRVADYLIALVADTQSTFYTEILRLPPAHSLTVTATSRRLRAYWRLDPPAAQGGADTAGQFRDLFTTAVRCRMRSAGRVAAMLSGGLDSSSIACVAAAITLQEKSAPLPTLSLVFDQTPRWNERPAIEAVLAQGGFDPAFIACDDYAPFGEVDGLLEEQEGVFFAPGLAVTRRIYAAAADRGIRVLLDGHGGDEVVSHGYGRLKELARAGRWVTLWQEVQGVSRTFGGAPWPLFAGFLEHYGPLRHLIRIRRAAGRLIRSMRGRRASADERPAWSRFVNADLVARTHLSDRFKVQRLMKKEALDSERGQHIWEVSSNLRSLVFEILDRSAAMAGVEARYPFWDKRLVEFCVALPAEEKLAGGWPRLILRRAMEGIVPAAIQWRRDKLDFTPHLVRGMLEHHRALLERILIEDDYGIGAYVDLANVAAAYRRVLDKVEAADGYDVHAIWRTVVLALWLRQSQRLPVRAIA